MPKTLVSVIVYDRFDNIKEWVRNWNQCQTQDCELIVIHNYENEEAKEAYRIYCAEVGIRYIPRCNIGFDVGAFQDVCLNRLEGFPQEFDYLLWCTDDVLPMKKDFLVQYVSKFMGPEIGVVAMEISKEVKLHIRTTGFMIRKGLLALLQFPADPVTTKEQCYHFEHRSNNTILEQITGLGFKSVEVEDIEHSPMWDTGHNSRAARKRRLRRENEHKKEFLETSSNESKKVTIICPAYNCYPEIISSMINQTHKNWELILIHDGPDKYGIQQIVDQCNDSRIVFFETELRAGNWGHSIRRDVLNELKEGKYSPSEFVVITNADNYHVPVYLEYMIKGFTSPQVVATYCSHMVHSYLAFGVITCKMIQGYVDMAGVMIRRDAACEVGFNHIEAHSADFLYFKDVFDKYGIKNFNRVEGALLIHN